MMSYILFSRLRHIRKARGLTQRELAEKVGVAQTCISQYERNVRYPAVDMVYELARVLRVPPERLLDAEPLDDLRPFKLKLPGRKHTGEKTPETYSANEE